MSVTPSAQNLGVGDAVSLACEVTSSYPPVSTYRWYKDGVAVGSERTLTLGRVRREDYGQYRCEAENAVGSGVAPAVTLYVFCECLGNLCPRLGHFWGGRRPWEWEVGSPASPGWGGQGLAPPGAGWRSRSWRTAMPPLCRACILCPSRW